MHHQDNNSSDSFFLKGESFNIQDLLKPTQTDLETPSHELRDAMTTAVTLEDKDKTWTFDDLEDVGLIHSQIFDPIRETFGHLRRLIPTESLKAAISPYLHQPHKEDQCMKMQWASRKSSEELFLEVNGDSFEKRYSAYQDISLPIIVQSRIELHCVHKIRIPKEEAHLDSFLIVTPVQSHGQGVYHTFSFCSVLPERGGSYRMRSSGRVASPSDEIEVLNRFTFPKDEFKCHCPSAEIISQGSFLMTLNEGLIKTIHISEEPTQDSNDIDLQIYIELQVDGIYKFN